MAKCRLVGRGWVNISQDKAKKILQWKDDGNMDKDRMVELNFTETAELGDIKQVMFDDPMAIQETELNEQKSRERQADIAEWNDYVNRCRAQSIEQKARRMVNGWCALLWTARMNKPAMKLPSQLQDELMIRMIKYFEENPTEWHAEQKVYNDLIPFGKISVVSEVKGVVSIGQAMQTSLGV